MCLTANLTQQTDPTHTKDLRDAFVNAIARRFRRIRGLVRKTVGYENDALGLRQDAEPVKEFYANSNGVVANAESEPAERYSFPTREARVDQFLKDLRQWIRNEIVVIASQAQARNGEAWWSNWIESAYVRGVQQAQGRLMQEGVSLTADDKETILNMPMHARQLQKLYTRTYENLTDITEDMANKVRRILTRGLIEGENPRRLATLINNEIEDITHTRAEVLARTEILYSHSDATLNEYERNGVGVVGHTKWIVSPDNRVCDYCLRLAGEPFTIQEMRNTAVRFRGQVYRLMPPAHPQGRCSPIPVLTDEELPPIEDRVPGEVIG